MGIFKEVLFPHERPAWSDEAGTVKLPRDSILLPADGGWAWDSGWQVAMDPHFQDRKGWSYANDFNGPFKKSRGLLDFVRRRKWVRVASRKKNESNQGGADAAFVGNSDILPQDYR